MWEASPFLTLLHFEAHFSCSLSGVLMHISVAHILLDVSCTFQLFLKGRHQLLLLFVQPSVFGVILLIGTGKGLAKAGGGTWRGGASPRIWPLSSGRQIFIRRSISRGQVHLQFWIRIVALLRKGEKNHWASGTHGPTCAIKSTRCTHIEVLVFPIPTRRGVSRVPRVEAVGRGARRPGSMCHPQ